MENKNSSGQTAWIVIGVVAALLIGCLLGSCAGGLVGYGLSRAVVEGEGVVTTVVPSYPVRQTPAASPNPTSPIQGAVIISKVISGSPAEQAGLVAGDIIVAINGVNLDSRQTLASRLASFKSGEKVRLTIERSGQSKEVDVTLGAKPGGAATQAWLGVYYRQASVSGD